MTVAELIAALHAYPSDAVVYVYNRSDDDAQPLVAVTESQDAPEDEVYLDFEMS